MNISSTEWTNKQQNEITFDIALESNSIKNNLFKDTTLKIQLPSQVEKVIPGNSSIVYGNGLTLQESYIETDKNGNMSIVVNLTGAQTQYDESNLGLVTDVKISATIILKKDIENIKDKLNLIYTNKYTLDGSAKEGNVEIPLQIKSYTAEENPIEEMMQNVNLSTQATIQNIADSLKLEVTPVKGDTTLKDGDIVYEGEFIKYNIKVTNISDTAVEGVKVIASIPEGVTYGELEADYYQSFGTYEYHFDENVKEKEIEIEELEGGKTFNTFYEIKVNDLNEQELEKQIATTIKVLCGDKTGSEYNITNVIKSAEAKVYVSAMLANTKDVWNYHVTIAGDQNVTLTFEVPAEFELTYIAEDDYKMALFDLYTATGKKLNIKLNTSKHKITRFTIININLKSHILSMLIIRGILVLPSPIKAP